MLLTTSDFVVSMMLLHTFQLNLKRDSVIKEHEERHQIYPTSNFWSKFNILDEIMQNFDCFLSVFLLLNTCLNIPVTHF